MDERVRRRMRTGRIEEKGRERMRGRRGFRGRDVIGKGDGFFMC
jgi:hypothetical protein